MTRTPPFDGADDGGDMTTPPNPRSDRELDRLLDGSADGSALSDALARLRTHPERVGPTEAGRALAEFVSAPHRPDVVVDHGSLHMPTTVSASTGSTNGRVLAAGLAAAVLAVAAIAGFLFAGGGNPDDVVTLDDPREATGDPSVPSSAPLDVASVESSSTTSTSSSSTTGAPTPTSSTVAPAVTSAPSTADTATSTSTTTSTVASTTTVVTTTVSPSTSSTTSSTTTTVASADRLGVVVPVLDVGTATVSVIGSTVVLDAVTAAPGWQVIDDSAEEPGTVDLSFRTGVDDERVDLDVEWEDGAVRVRIRDRRNDTETERPL